ncbi:MAG: hypothetical protein DLM69_01100 [Candidatus Chloroheliales bacterium]|nr:MAG: hypothetical protein DLM69_01100 [Chloroflexota bacterium]
MKPRASNRQRGCIISDEEMEMALHRMMREQYATAEPSAQSWRKLHSNLVAGQPLDPRQEVQPRLIGVRLAWLNLFVPRMMQTALAVVILLATVLTNGADLGGFMQHQSANHTQTAPSGQILDDRTQDPPVMKNLPNLDQPAGQPQTDNSQNGSNSVSSYERVRNDVYPVAVSYDNSPRRTGEYFVH